MPRMNVSWCKGHTTIFSQMPTIVCCVVVALGLDLVFDWLVVMHMCLYCFLLVRLRKVSK